jgi:gamma-glutamyltranspeptidase / glutathione hydrolase
MTPTIVLDAQRRPVLVVGTPGGTTIPTTVFQIMTAVLDHGLALQAAIEAPRFHHQWDPDAMHFERGFAPAVVDSLEAMGWQMRQRGGTSGAVSAIQITYDPAGGVEALVGARDPRRDITPDGH